MIIEQEVKEDGFILDIAINFLKYDDKYFLDLLRILEFNFFNDKYDAYKFLLGSSNDSYEDDEPHFKILYRNVKYNNSEIIIKLFSYMFKDIRDNELSKTVLNFKNENNL